MDIKLPADLDLYVQEQLSGGVFASADEVIQTALRQMRDRAAKRAEIRRTFIEEDLDVLAGSAS